MKILVGYNGGEVGRINLSMARDYAKLQNSFVYIITSMTGGESETQSDILKANQGLAFAENFMKRSDVRCEILLSVRGFSPGEDLIKFAKDTKIDHIFLGIKQKSRTQKIILGSTSQYIILRSPCPVTTVSFNLTIIKNEDLLNDRHILVVDDEPDVLESVEELLDMCVIDTAATFEEAKKKLKNREYDFTILDIMGVQGYEILKLTRKKNIPTLMLTANALSPDHLKKSIQIGSDAYIPKEEMVNIADHIADVIKARITGIQSSGVWFKTLKNFFDKSFGKNWRDEERSFWNKFDEKYRE